MNTPAEDALDRTKRINELIDVLALHTRTTTPQPRRTGELARLLLEERMATQAQLDMAHVSNVCETDAGPRESSIAMRVSCLRMREQSLRDEQEGGDDLSTVCRNVEASPPAEPNRDDARSTPRPASGYNAGVKCDVEEGPCACGAWHMKRADTRDARAAAEAARERQIEAAARIYLDSRSEYAERVLQELLDGDRNEIPPHVEERRDVDLQDDARANRGVKQTSGGLSQCASESISGFAEPMAMQNEGGSGAAEKYEYPPQASATVTQTLIDTPRSPAPVGEAGAFVSLDARAAAEAAAEPAVQELQNLLDDWRTRDAVRIVASHMQSLLAAQLERLRGEVETWLITIEAHCTVIAEPSKGDDAGELAACIKGNVGEIRLILTAPAPAPAPAATKAREGGSDGTANEQGGKRE